MAKPSLNVRLMNPDTGEFINAKLIKTSSGGKFMKLWQDTGFEGRIWSLRGSSVKMLLFLTDIAGWQNVVPGPSEVARKLDWPPSNASRAYRELIEASFLIKGGSEFHLSPLYCWKGSDSQYEEALRRLPGRELISS